MRPFSFYLGTIDTVLTVNAGDDRVNGSARQLAE